MNEQITPPLKSKYLTNHNNKKLLRITIVFKNCCLKKAAIFLGHRKFCKLG